MTDKTAWNPNMDEAPALTLTKALYEIARANKRASKILVSYDFLMKLRRDVEYYRTAMPHTCLWVSLWKRIVSSRIGSLWTGTGTPYFSRPRRRHDRAT